MPIYVNIEFTHFSKFSNVSRQIDYCFTTDVIAILFLEILYTTRIKQAQHINIKTGKLYIVIEKINYYRIVLFLSIYLI